jgi:hypothetical protein
MKPSLSVLTRSSIIVVIVAAGFAAMAQDNKIVIHVIDGRNGKPVSNEHILIFQGVSAEDIRELKNHLDLQTDANGMAFLPTDAMPQIQVSVDWHKVCQSSSSKLIFSLEEIKKNGVATPNTCGSIARKLAPNQFYVFTRPLNFREKMRL